MQELNQKKWKAIPIIDLFRLPFVPGKGKGLNHLQQTTAGGISYIGATNRNNGVLCFIEKTDYTSKLIQKGNCIGFIKNGDGSAGYSIYKKEQFISTSDVIYGYADWLTRDNALFFIAAQDKIEKKYSHGYKRNQLHLRGDKVMLPISTSGNPDYEYMAEYVREKRHVMLTKYRTLLKERIADLGEHVHIPSLGEKEWGTFFIEDIFKNIRRPVARNKDDYEYGNVPFVASGAINNGVMKLCTPHQFEKLDKGACITVSPVDGSSFYHPYDFLGRGGAGSSVLMLYSDNNELYSGLFIAKMIYQTCSKYTYGRMGNKDGIKRERVQLPINKEHKPDYQYMEQYIKNMMLKKYKQYLTFLDKKVERL